MFFYKGNIKLIEDVNETKIKNINDNLLSQKDFGSQLVLMKVKMIFVLKRT